MPDDLICRLRQVLLAVENVSVSITRLCVLRRSLFVLERRSSWAIRRWNWSCNYDRLIVRIHCLFRAQNSYLRLSFTTNRTPTHWNNFLCICLINMLHCSVLKGRMTKLHRMEMSTCCYIWPEVMITRINNLVT